MKTNQLVYVFSLLLLVACNKPTPEEPRVEPGDSTKTETQYRKGEIAYESEDNCTHLVFEDKLGTDFESALQALIASRDELASLGEDLYVKKSEIHGVELKDSVKVYSLMFCKQVSGAAYPIQPLYAASDAIDTQGNHFLIQWCSERTDPNKLVYQYSELTFEKNYGATFEDAYPTILPDIDAYVQLLRFESSALDFDNYIIKQTGVLVLNAPVPEVEFVKLDIYVFNTSTDEYIFFKDYCLLSTVGDSYVINNHNEWGMD
ncbi:MAG: hypothetical protein IKO66_07305 [Paludibacteraceae bacterium]|nr:hypothetical protein [Paludibacteraceae bacterium]